MNRKMSNQLSSSPTERSRMLIDSDPGLRLTIERLAAEAHLSEFHYIRLFKRHFFTTPHQYLLRRRIERAKQLLSDTDLRVTEICFEVGFESLGSFSSLFRRVVGWAPSVYRVRCRRQRREPRRFIPGCFWEMHNLGAASSPQLPGA